MLLLPLLLLLLQKPAMSFSALPVDMWKLVLKHIPLRDRLGSCSLVSKTFHAASAAATESISVYDQHREDGLLAWLAQDYGRHVTRLVIWSASALTALPCLHNLRELELGFCRVQLGPTGSQPGVLQACTGLTKLVIHGSSAFDKDTAAGSLSVLVNLQSLRVETPPCYANSQSPGNYFSLPGTVLPSLVRLTSLELSTPQLEGMQHLSSMSRLCELKLTFQSPVSFTPALAPSGFYLPPSLRSLKLLAELLYDPWVLDPTVLQKATGLQVLVVHCAIVSDGAALLAVLSTMQQLQQLRLHCKSIGWPAVSLAYSALIPTSLMKLELHLCLPPAGAMQHTFTPGRVLPQLQHIMMRPSYALTRPLYDCDQAELSSLASTCPSLQELQCGLLPGVSMACCTQLTGLRTLHVLQAGSVEHHTARVQELAALTTLHCLELGWELAGSKLSCAALQPLTALKQLVWLQCWQSPTAGSDAHTEGGTLAFIVVSLFVGVPSGSQHIVGKVHVCDLSVIHWLV